MSVRVNKENLEFHLQTKNISYLFHVMENGELGQLYYGKKIRHKECFDDLKKREFRMIVPTLDEEKEDFSLDTLKQEYPSYGNGDFRYPAFQIEFPDGSRVTEMSFDSYELYDGKRPIEGLPSSYAEENDDVQTLVITLIDQLTQLKIELNYSVFNNADVITRSAKFINEADKNLKIPIAMSGGVDLPDSKYNLLQLSGSWTRERHMYKRPLTRGIQAISSTRNSSSAQQNPFLALLGKNATEYGGEVYGFQLVYSGSFLGQVEVDHYDTTRVLMGINPFEFTWNLKSNEIFQTPEVVLTYTNKGLNQMSQNLHRFYAGHLINKRWINKERPVLINNWEATYFDFDENKIIDIVKAAKNLGIELFVLDDGWFGERNSDRTSLGDWQVNLAKLPNGLSGLAERIKKEGVQFGLWFESEMISKESQLFLKHPDWAIQIPGRKMTPSRTQQVLDFSRSEIVDYMYKIISDAIEEADLSYIKWDMNRHITEMFSLSLPAEQQKEMGHRYILGVYDLYERLTTNYPNVLFESCSSGGGRFDLGMLYYAPQTWTSDNTDAIERLKIQYGTSICYPLSSMGAHVAAVPNHQVRRMTSLKTRGDVAFFGVLGYELDISKMTENEKNEMIAQIKFYKKYRQIFQFGQFYRLESPFEENGNVTSWLVVNEDKTIAIAGRYQVLSEPNPECKRLYFKGLDPEKKYRVNEMKEIFYGDELMNAGLFIDELFHIYGDFDKTFDFSSKLFLIKEV